MHIAKINPLNLMKCSGGLHISYFWLYYSIHVVCVGVFVKSSIQKHDCVIFDRIKTCRLAGQLVLLLSTGSKGCCGF